MPTYQGCLFTKVGPMAGNHDLSGDMTLPAFTSQSINATVSGTQVALFKD